MSRSMFVGCQELTRVVGDAQGKRDWKALSERMAGHIREFEAQGKLPSGVTFPPTELANIGDEAKKRIVGDIERGACQGPRQEGVIRQIDGLFLQQTGLFLGAMTALGVSERVCRAQAT